MKDKEAVMKAYALLMAKMASPLRRSWLIMEKRDEFYKSGMRDKSSKSGTVPPKSAQMTALLMFDRKKFFTRFCTEKLLSPSATDTGIVRKILKEMLTFGIMFSNDLFNISSKIFFGLNKSELNK